MKNNYNCVDNRTLLITAITYQYRHDNIASLHAELTELAKMVCISIFHFLNSGHSSSMKAVDENGSAKVINSYNELITKAFLSLCSDSPDERASDAIQECIVFILDTLHKYNSLDKCVKIDGKKIHIMKLIYRHMSQYIKGNKAQIANTKCVYVDDINALYEQYIKLNRFESGMIQSDNATSQDADKADKLIESLALTNRQREILALRLQGKSIADIGKLLHISLQCVKKHLQKIQQSAIKSDLLNTDCFQSVTVKADNKGKQPVKLIANYDNEIVGVYDSIGQCAVMLGLSKSKVSEVLKGTRTHTKGYTFEYVTDTDVIIESHLHETVKIVSNKHIRKVTDNDIPEYLKSMKRVSIQ